MKRFLTVLLAVIITASSAVSVFAAGEDVNTTAPETTADVIDKNDPEETSTEPTTGSGTTEPVENPKTDDDIISYSGTAGANLKYSFNRHTAVLTFSGSGTAMKTCSKGNYPWNKFAGEIKKINLKKAKNLSAVSKYAFYNLGSLSSVNYSNKITAFSEGAFMNTPKLRSFVVYKNVIRVGKDAFKGSGVKSIEFKSRNTKVYQSKNTIPAGALIKTFNPSKAYNYAIKYKRSTYIFVNRIKFSDDNEILTIGEKYTCKVAFKPDNASNKRLIWKSGNTKIAAVNNKGVVKAKKKGICYITATLKKDSRIKTAKKFKVIVTDYKFTKKLLTKNNCYRQSSAISPKGIVVHSTGCNTPSAYSYIKNWNVPKPGGREVCVHGFLGKNSRGKVSFYQALPFEMACWGVGRGNKGSYNYYPGYIQFECCEDSLASASYFNTIYSEATDLCAYLCLRYNISYTKVVSHLEACKQGYGSAHGDIDHWLKRFGKTMNDFRYTVKTKIYRIDPSPDLHSGSKYPKVEIISPTSLRSKNAVDDYGTSSRILKKIKAGEMVTFIRDNLDGWSYVKISSGKKGYILNSKFKMKYTSKCVNKKLNFSTLCYSRPTKNSKYLVRTVPKGKAVTVISEITKGTKKGWVYIKYKGGRYYIRKQW